MTTVAGIRPGDSDVLVREAHFVVVRIHCQPLTDFAEATEILRHTRIFTNRADDGDQYSGEDPDNRNDYQKLNQRERGTPGCSRPHSVSGGRGGLRVRWGEVHLI